MSRAIKSTLGSKFDVDVVEMPVADGGEGTVDCFLESMKGEKIYVNVLNPLQKEVKAFYGLLSGDVAVIEMAAASGLYLIEQKDCNPLKTTTFGTGQLIKAALDKGCKKIILGLGGSATNDCGHGMAKALGAKFVDTNGKEINEVGGGILNQIASIDVATLDARINKCEFIVASDVTNSLCGLKGASYVFGPQKGADEQMCKTLDDNLQHFGQLIEKTLNKPVINRPGAGAAGGLGAGVFGFLDGRFNRGIDLLKDIAKFDDKIQGARYIFTGEGQIDDQTLDGKALSGVLESAKKYNIPVIAFAGGLPLNETSLYNAGFHSVISIVNKPMDVSQAMTNAEILLFNAVQRVCKLIA